MNNRQALTIWKDGAHEVWGGMDAFYAQADPDFLVNIGLGDLEELVFALPQNTGLTLSVWKSGEWTVHAEGDAYYVAQGDGDWLLNVGVANIKEMAEIDWHRSPVPAIGRSEK